MLIAKGYAPSFILIDGRTIRPANGSALLHDPTGKYWPRCSGLVAPFRKTRQETDNQTAQIYFGYRPRLGEMPAPPRALNQWAYVGDVADSVCVANGDCGEILYRRTGTHKASYYHPVEGVKRGAARLYRRGRLLRVELGDGCEWNWRGIVKP